MTSALPALRVRERSGDRTRRRLFEAAVEEFCSVGVEEASINRIAVAAGVSRAAFYFHFPTKDHVLLELQWSFEEPIAARVRAAKTLDDAFVALADGLALAIEALKNPDVFAEMVRIHTRHSAVDAQAQQPHYLMHAVAARFAEAHAAGRLRGGLEPGRATFLFLTSLFGYLSVPPDYKQSREDLQTLTSLFLDGADAGRAASVLRASTKPRSPAKPGSPAKRARKT